MTNKQRGELSVTLSGKNYVLRPSFQALAEIEGELDLPLIRILEKVSHGELRLMEQVAILHAGLGSKALSRDAVMAIVATSSTAELGRAIGQFFIEGLAIDEQKSTA